MKEGISQLHHHQSLIGTYFIDIPEAIKGKDIHDGTRSQNVWIDKNDAKQFVWHANSSNSNQH